MWGKGAYFAKNASYSDHYSHKNIYNRNKLLLLCKVGLGYN